MSFHLHICDGYDWRRPSSSIWVWWNAEGAIRLHNIHLK
jgi:hypothetical protein